MPLESKNRVTCPGCALACDDIAVDVQFNKIQKVYNACLRGNEKLMFSGSKERFATPFTRDAKNKAPKEIKMDQAMLLAAKTIQDSQNVLILGGTKLESSAQEQLVELARIVGATMSFAGAEVLSHVKDAMKDAGASFTTIGEIANNADLLLFWGANPIDFAPKLVVKTVFSRGRYRQTGKEVKKFAVLDGNPTPTMERADIKVLMHPGNDTRYLGLICRELQAAGVLDERDLEWIGFTKEELTSLGPDIPPSIKELARTIELTEYGVILVGERLLNPAAIEREPDLLEKMFRVGSILNRDRRMSVLPLSYHLNFAGLVHALATANHEVNVKDFKSIADSLEDFDVVICAGFDLVGKLDDKQLARLKESKIVVFDYKKNCTTTVADLFLPVAMMGIETGGKVYRIDGSLVSLSKCVEPREGLSTDAKLLQELGDFIQNGGQSIFNSPGTSIN